MHRTERKEYSGGGEGFFVTSALFHPRPSMRKLCPNLDQEDGLDTVLEVPVPEETFTSGSKARGSCKAGCSNTKAWMRNHNDRSESSSLSRCAQLQQLLGVIGAPLVPLPIPAQQSIICCDVRNAPIEASMAKYIVRQYIAAAGGEKVLNSIDSMYAMGKVQMMVSEFRTGGNNNISSNNKKAARGGGEMGGFVLWQKKPDLWCLELVVSGCKISAGSDGRVAWRQTPWHNSHVSRGPPRPLRRSLQGLDPRPTANLFSNSVCIGEKTINGHDCFMLRLDAEASTLRARSSNNVEIIRHTMWGYFSQRTGLLVQLEDTHLIRIKAASEPSVYWETTMQSSIEDYRTIDGISIAHAGRTMLSSFRFGDSNDGQTRTCMEETWSVEEVDFNIQGLSIDCFLPPSDLKQELEGCDFLVKNVCPDIKVEYPAIKVGPSQIAAVDLNDTDFKEQEDGNSPM